MDVDEGGVNEGGGDATKMKPFTKADESRLVLFDGTLYHIQVSHTSQQTYTEKPLQDEVLKVLSPMLYYQGKCGPIRTENIVVTAQIKKSLLESEHCVESEEGEKVEFSPMKLCFTVNMISKELN
eukprot:TRINITY_DN930_c0_g2_i4.p3 TRINITY_DN930_c0_g2~~TRINITY_DN930_c0_g2_i4.p3  ORF type:complete len:125 (+),score=31.33 TRINITY_DN930_c0_g2_i4:1389-1763(+)